MTVDSVRLSEGIVVWSGWGTSTRPVRDEARVKRAFGEDISVELVLAIRRAEDDFYESDARYNVEDLEEMGKVAAERFRRIHPEIRDDAIQALAWCYTYDFK